MASPASRRSTPSRSTSNGIRRVNGFHESPSQQSIEDYGRVYASEQRNLKRRLDDQTSEQQRKHMRALDRGLEEHIRIRESAERVLEFNRLERERAERQKAEDEARRIEEARKRLEQQKEDEKRRRAEEQRAREEEARKQELRRQQEEEEARKRAAAREKEEEDAKQRAAVQQQSEEAERAKKLQQQREESDRKAREDAESKQREQNAQKERESAAQQSGQSASLPNGAVSAQNASSISSVPAGVVSSLQEMEAIHSRYLDLHARLKDMREQVRSETKAVSKAQGAQLFEWKQAIVMRIGMIRKADDAESKKGNADRMKAIVSYLDAAAKTKQPMIDITQYLVQNEQPQGAPKEGPGQLLYLLNILAKLIIKQFMLEAGLEAEVGNSLGVLLATVFARKEYLFNGQSLIDIVWAKFHKRCPALFGIHGDERTLEGRARIGWERTGEKLTHGMYYTGIRGLGIGFANITLRSFAKSQNQNPAPNRLFWQAMARLLNTPAEEVQPTHFELLKGIIDSCAPRMVGIYGPAALALIRQAVFQFPRKLEKARNQSAPAHEKANSFEAIPQQLAQDFNISL